MADEGEHLGATINTMHCIVSYRAEGDDWLKMTDRLATFAIGRDSR